MLYVKWDVVIYLSRNRFWRKTVFWLILLDRVRFGYETAKIEFLLCFV